MFWSVTGTVVVEWPAFSTIAPDVSPGVEGVETFNVTGCEAPGASVTLDGVTVPNVVYVAELAENTTGPV